MTHTATAEDPVTCSACGATTHLCENTLTGNVLVVDTPGDLDAAHPCVLGRTAAVLTIRGGTATVAPLREDGRTYVANALRGTRSGPAEWAATATRQLKGYSVVVLTRGSVPPDLYGGAG